MSALPFKCNFKSSVKLKVNREKSWSEAEVLCDEGVTGKSCELLIVSNIHFYNASLFD